MTDLERPTVTPLTLSEDPPPPRSKPRLRKLRLLGLLIPLALLALVSTVFGMMMAVASDLPALENEKRFQGEGAKNSILLDSTGKHVLGRLTSNQHRIYVRDSQIAPVMRAAIISVEDQRFLTNSGIDLKGIARAFVQDVLKGGAVQGASTITQQFVKLALQAQDKRTVFQKLREAALAYHLTRKWSKQKILTEYLNSIYFGNGAYGIEAAAETYFGDDVNHQGCGKTLTNLCATQLQPQEAALLAGIVQNPTGYDPVVHPIAARRRRDVVLKKMLQQHYISQLQYAKAVAESLPARDTIHPPEVNSVAPYFTTWVRQQLVDRYGAQKVFEGGLKVRTTLDPQIQDAAQKAVNGWLANNPSGPTASLVAIDNQNGQVRAMVSGSLDYSKRPFNLATQGQRQPGSAFKPFILARALQDGVSPGSVWTSAKKIFCVVRSKKTGRCTEEFPVENDESTYVGQRTLANALTFSDNTVFAQVGIRIGTARVASLARRMGIRTPVSHNPAMTLGGLKEGVTPLDMAHAYETFATDGQRITGTLGASDQGPVGVRSITDSTGKVFTNHTEKIPVLPANVAATAKEIMTTVISQGTAKRAAVGGFEAGKTGTTSNYGDAWFIGFTDRLTVAVWVGYPDKLVSMKTDFNGAPVEGGTFPALIWHDFMQSANGIYDTRLAKARLSQGLPADTSTQTDTTATVPSSTDQTATDPNAGTSTKSSTPATTPAAKPKATVQTPAPTPTPTTTPTPTAGTDPTTTQPADGTSGGAPAAP